MIIILLLSLVLINEGKMNAQELPAGFVLEVFDETKSSSVKQIFIEIDYIKNISPDSIFLNDKKGKPQLWIGTNLLTVLEEKADVNYNDISKLAVTAPDGYNSVIFGNLIAHLKTAMLAYGIGGEKKWLKKYGNFRLIFPGLREMYFVDNPEKVIIYTNTPESSVHTIQLHFLERSREKSNPAKAESVAVEEILSSFNLSGINFSVLTSDSLEREYLNNELIRRLYLKREKSGTWKIDGEKVPVGLRTRNIFYFFSGNVGIFLKSLSEEENIIWENYLNNLIKTNEFRMEIILTGEENIQIENSGESSIYKIIEKQWEQFSNIDYVRISWK
jgi:hypothetical protein